MEKSYEKISPTAKFVAYGRSFTDIPFAKEVAAESGAEKAYRELTRGVEQTGSLPPLWEARYKATDRILGQRGATQVLEVAAGLSPRGLAMTENPAVVYVVTDLPQILEEEQAIAEAILAKLNIRRPNLHFQIANVLDRESLSRAVIFFKPNRPMAVITEGLLPYLSRREKEVAAKNIRRLLVKHGGIWITPDVSTKQSWSDVSRIDRVSMGQRIRKISGVTGRNIRSNVFANESEVKQFFDGAGFAIQEYQQTEVFEDLYSVKSYNLNRDETLRILKGRRTLILTPRHAARAVK